MTNYELNGSNPHSLGVENTPKCGVFWLIHPQILAFIKPITAKTTTLPPFNRLSENDSNFPHS